MRSLLLTLVLANLLLLAWQFWVEPSARVVDAGDGLVLYGNRNPPMPKTAPGQAVPATASEVAAAAIPGGA